MKNKILLLLVLVSFSLNAQVKKGILIVSFGTSYPEARELCIESIEQKARENFKGYEVHRAFTSKIVRKILRTRDSIFVDSPTEELDKMIAEGFDEIYVQPLHIMPGHEYHEIARSVMARKNKVKKITIGKALLFSEKDFNRAIEALKFQIDKFPNKAIVLVGHGTTHPANSLYSQLQDMLYDMKINAFVGNIEGYPKLPNLIKKLKMHKVKDVVLMPFMIVAGDHAQNDIGSNEEDSWLTILTNEGFNTEVYMHGLGENKMVQDIYIQNIKDMIEGKPLFIKHHH